MTAAQQKASDPAHSVWVGASAGTGKTKVLTDRVLRLLLAGTRPNKILCITFTKAAASEMANRIHGELAEWAVLEEKALAEAIQNLTGTPPDEKKLNRARRLFAEVLDSPDGIRLQTIHSFCQSLLSRFPIEAGIAPHFRVIDEMTSAELLQEAKLRLMSQGQREADRHLREAIEGLAVKVYESAFVELMQALLAERGMIQRQLQQPGGIIRFNTRIYEALGLVYGTREEDVLDLACHAGEFDAIGIKQLMQVLLEGTAAEKKRGEILARWLAEPGNRAAIFDEYKTLFLVKNDDTPKQVSSVINKSSLKAFPAAEEIIRREQQRLIEVTDRLKAVRIARFSEQLIAVAEALIGPHAGLYSRLKEARGFLDYEDLILYSRQLLYREGISPWVLFKLDGGIDHLLVDEAQDTSPLQWQLIRAMTEEFFAGEGAREANRTVFVVGDEKQSIYSFQGADPDAFQKMRAFFHRRSEEAQKEFHHVALDKSFRSTEAVLQMVDTVFRHEAARGGLNIGEELLKHEAHRLGHAGKVELWPLIEPEGDEELEPWPLPEKRQEIRTPQARLAERIARQIRRWLDAETLLPARGRSVNAGDILILVRRRGPLFEEIFRALKQHHVPVAGSDRMVLAENIAVQDLLALAQFSLLPEDDLNLACLLKSPLFGFDEEMLFTLAYDRGESSLWDRLREFANPQSGFGGGEIKAAFSPPRLNSASGEAGFACSPVKEERFTEAYTKLAATLNSADYIPPYEFFARALDAEGGRSQFIARMGEQVNDPLDEFLNMALQYEQAHAPSLQGFLHWFASGETEIRRDLEQARNEVRVMTVHGSKGLQAPIVFLPDTTTRPKNDRKFYWTGEGEDDVLLWSSAKTGDAKRLSQLRQKYESEVNEEYMRLLYVAMTRAEDQLYLCGAKGKNSVRGETWYSLMETAMLELGEETETEIGGERLTIHRFATEQTETVKEKETSEKARKVSPLPEFVHRSAPEEPLPPTPLSPSKPEAEEPPMRSPASGSGIWQRGRLVHKLLEILPELPEETRWPAAEHLLEIQAPEMNTGERQDLLKQLKQLLESPEFAPLFGPGSQAEVPVTGVIGEQVISGQIDRLAVLPEKIIIVDYKTNREPPESAGKIPAAYRRQMTAYREVIRRIYPGREIETALLWTETLEFMVVEPEPLPSLDSGRVSTYI